MMSVELFVKIFENDDVFRRFIVTCKWCKNHIVIDLQLLNAKYSEERFYPSYLIDKVGDDPPCLEENRRRVSHHLLYQLRYDRDCELLKFICGKCNRYKFDVTVKREGCNVFGPERRRIPVVKLESSTAGRECRRP